MGTYQAGARPRARNLRQSMSDAEKELWYRLRNRQLLGFKFVRQHPIGPYIADFACRDGDLVVEVDGGQHADSHADKIRTTHIQSKGYEVLRFWNNEVLTNLDGVLVTIANALQKAPSPGLRYTQPDLSPKGEANTRQRF